MRWTTPHPERRQQLRSTTRPIDGIDFLEVVDGEAPTPGWRQRILLVRFFKDARAHALTPANVRLTGGVRVRARDLRILGFRPLPEAAAAPPFAALAAWLGALQDRLIHDDSDDPAHWWVLLVDRRGDASPYTLELVAGDGAGPPPGLDRVLSRITFSFKVECPTDFDCAPEPPGPPEPAPEPRLDYLAKDFHSFRRLMLERMAAVAPDWTERSAADLGVTLIELVAYAADHLSYQQDAVATEAYLGTARRRVSVRRHLRLLDYVLHEGCNARTVVHVAVTAPFHLPAGTPVLTTVGRSTVIHPDEVPSLESAAPLWFETMHPVDLLPAHNAIEIYAWGEIDATLPKGATRATLGGADLALAPGDLLLFEQVLDPHGAGAEGDPALRHVVRLTEVGVPVVDALYDTPEAPVVVREVAWADADALPFTLCLRSVALPSGERAPAALARGNLVLADHGRTGGAAEALRPPDGPHRSVRLAEPDLTFREAWDEAVGRSLPARAALAQDPRRATAALIVEEVDTGTPWHPRPDLLSSRGHERHFVVEMESDRTAHLRFGDGAHGALPPSGGLLRARYRWGNGTAGNVGADALTRIVHDLAGGYVLSVRNPIPAVTGVDPEPLATARLHGPHAFRRQMRAVTAEDWAEICRRHPEVQRAVATLRWTGSWYTVHLAVDRFGGAPVDEAFVERLRAFLEPFRLAGMDLEIDPPRFVPLDVALSICIEDGYSRGEVRRRLRERLGSGRLRDGRRAFFHPDHFSFGDPVHLSRIVAAAAEVPGVAWVDATANGRNRFQRLHEAAQGELEEGVIPMGRLEVARLDDDPNQPENGRLTLHMSGGLR